MSQNSEFSCDICHHEHSPTFDCVNDANAPWNSPSDDNTYTACAHTKTIDLPPSDEYTERVQCFACGWVSDTGTSDWRAPRVAVAITQEPSEEYEEGLRDGVQMGETAAYNRIRQIIEDYRAEVMADAEVADFEDEDIGWDGVCSDLLAAIDQVERSASHDRGHR